MKMEKTILNLDVEKRARISKLEGGIEFQRKLACLNIRAGKFIKKIAVQPFRGPIIVEIDRRKIAIGRGMANKIYVEDSI
jgi:ferrous iron transport protein A